MNFTNKKSNSWLIIIAFLLFFGAIIFGVKGENYILTADLYVNNFIPSIRSVFLDYFFIGISYFGKWEVVAILAILVAIIWVRKKKWNYVLFLASSLLGAEILVWVMKHLIQRVRPPFSQAIVLEDGFSFPSGHSTLAMAFLGTLIFISWDFFQEIKKKKSIVYGLAVVIILVGFSRIYLGVHWLSDVLASYFLGVAVVLLVREILKLTKNKE